MKGLNYVLLAGLWVEPRSGYDLAHWFQKAARSYWSAHHSSIYPALAALEARGLVEHREAPSERGPKRKVYRLTPEGEAVLRAWVAEAPAPPEVHDEQPVKVLALDLLPDDEAVAHLKAARDRAQAQGDVYAALLLQMDEEEDDGQGRHWLGPRLTLMRGVRVQEAYARWCEEAIHLFWEVRAHSTRSSSRSSSKGVPLSD